LADDIYLPVQRYYDSLTFKINQISQHTLLQTQIALDLIIPMDMRMHEVALDDTCGQSGSEIHENESKTEYKFLLFITYQHTAGG
jgi:hypothetical protein